MKHCSRRMYERIGNSSLEIFAVRQSASSARQRQQVFQGERMGDLNIIFTEAELLVSKKSYSSWREIQDEYDDYKASLGPWDAKRLIVAS